MTALELKRKTRKIAKSVPGRVNDLNTIFLLQDDKINSDHFLYLKELTSLNDDVLSKWLNIDVKTFRSYKSSKKTISLGAREHVITLLSLFLHGRQVFGSMAKFEKWLNTDNFIFDGKAPNNFLTAISGIRFIDGRLTGMEYGDNA